MFNLLLEPSNYYFNSYAIPVMLVGIFLFSIGIFILKQNKRSSINISFFLECLSTGFWLFTISLVYLSCSARTALIWYRYFTFFGVISIMPNLLLFAVACAGELKRRKIFLIINYIISISFYVLAISSDKLISPYEIRRYFWGFYPIYKPWAGLFLLFFTIQFAIGIGILYSVYRFEPNQTKRMQIRTIIFALLTAFPASSDFLPKFFKVPIYPYGYIFMFMYLCIVAYSIVRYRAFDIETVLHKTIMWLFTFLFIIIPVFFLYRWVSPYLRESISLQITFWIIAFLSLTFYLRVIQPRVDHFFQRRQSDLEQITNRFIEDLVHLKGLNQLIQRIETTIADTLYPQSIGIFIYSEETGSYKLSNPKNISQKNRELKIDDPFLSWLTRNNKIAYRQFVDIDPGYALIRKEAKTYFDLTDAYVVIPLILNEKLLGVINLSKKANLKRYSAADFHFLTILKNQSTIAISNSLVYENIEEQVRQRTKELMEVQKQLIQAEKLATVGTLAGGVAHEINNPLTAILTNVQMLLASNEIDDKLDRESLELIEEATKRCRTIVQKLMTYAKKPLEATEISRVNLFNVIKNVVSFLDYQLEQENIKIITDIEEDNYWVMGNQNELEQVITNIILNAKDAIKQIKKSGNIHISFAKNGEWIKIAIRDEGVGIPKEIIHKIFDPFFTTKEVGKGTGLGLSICQAIIEKHNGLINVSCEHNKGSIFTVQLPKAKIKSDMDKAKMSKT